MKKFEGYVEFSGLRLPPPGMVRHGGKTDEHHVRSAKDIVARAERNAQLTSSDRVLDIGCGAGRFLIGLLAKFGRVERYVGMDVRKPVIEWCQEVLIQPERGDISFEWLDVENPRYNRHGANPDMSPIFPLSPASIDVAVLFSVFSHMRPEMTARYLEEIARVLSDSGRCLCTTYTENDVPDWEENPSNYVRDWKGPLHCTRFRRGYFEELVRASGLVVSKFNYRDLQGRQSTYVLTKAT